jgi:hypothetical protein
MFACLVPAAPLCSSAHSGEGFLGFLVLKTHRLLHKQARSVELFAVAEWDMQVDMLCPADASLFLCDLTASSVVRWK